MRQALSIPLPRAVRWLYYWFSGRGLKNLQRLALREITRGCRALGSFWSILVSEDYAASKAPIYSPKLIDSQVTGTTSTVTSIYLAPTTLSAITFNFLFSLSGELRAAHIISKGNPFGTFLGGLAAAIGVVNVYLLHCWLEGKSKIDDSTGVLRVPREVEQQELDFSENKAFEAAQSGDINAKKTALAQN